MEQALRVREMEFLRHRLHGLESGQAYAGVPKAVADARLAACRECEYGIDSQDLCIECGCKVSVKRWVPWWFCKRGKFGAHEAVT